MTRYIATVLFGTAMLVAANHSVLAPGDPPLTRADLTKISSLVQWMLDAQFTPDESARFEQTQIEAWTRNDQQFRQNLLVLVKTHDIIAAQTEEQRAKVRPQMQDAFLQTLRKNQENAGSKLMLAAYYRTHGGGSLPASAPAQSGFPSTLAGSWSSLHGSTTTFVDRSTGAHATPSGNGMLYTILADGRYQSTGIITSTLYSCTITVNAYEEGTIRIDGNVLVFDSKGGTIDTKDTCRSSGNTRKPLQANQKTYNWRFKNDQYGYYFCIVNNRIKEDCARRE